MVDFVDESGTMVFSVMHGLMAVKGIFNASHLNKVIRQSTNSFFLI